jgi:hypothetical protein
MSTPTVPGDRDGSDDAGGGRKRRIATVAGATAVLAAALGATACAAQPTGNSTQASLNGSAQPAGAASPSEATPSADAPMTTATASMKHAKTPKRSTASSAAPHSGHHAKSPEPTTWPASSAPATSPAGAPASSAPATWAAPSTPSTPSASSAPSTGSTPSQPATSGSSNQALSVSRSCAAQITVLEEQAFSPCSFTKSGGNPDYLYAVNVYVNGDLALEAGSTPPGLTFNETNNDTVFTIGGKPEQPGTYTLRVEFYAGSDSASASFTLVVNQDPNLKRLP